MSSDHDDEPCCDECAEAMSKTTKHIVCVPTPVFVFMLIVMVGVETLTVFGPTLKAMLGG